MVQRRTFCKLVGLSAASLVTGGVLGACSRETLPEIMGAGRGGDALHGGFAAVGQPLVSFTTSVDVLVIGSGISGLSAAMAPVEAGYSVMVADKLTMLGGESYTANGVMYVAGSSLQRRAGLSLTAQDAWANRKAQLVATGMTDSHFVQTLYEQGANWVDKLANDYGAKFADPNDYAKEGENDAIVLPKTGVGDMSSVLLPLRDGLSGKGVNFQTQHRAIALIVSPAGTVCGVRFTFDKDGSSVDVEARRVIIATGGFASSQAMIQTYAPAWLKVGCCTYASVGEGHQLAISMGAQIDGMATTMPLISDATPAAAWGLFGPTLGVDLQGKRFAREDDANACPTTCFSDACGLWWTIFDNQLLNGTLSSSVAAVKSKNAKRLVGPFSDVKGLAEGIGVSSESLQATFDHYEEIVLAGKDADFGRVAQLKKLSSPYYALKQLPVRYRSYGGIKTDPSGRVLGVAGTIIPYLYCAGSVAMGGGAGLASEGAFGMLVGQAVAQSLSTR